MPAGELSVFSIQAEPCGGMVKYRCVDPHALESRSLMVVMACFAKLVSDGGMVTAMVADALTNLRMALKAFLVGKHLPDRMTLYTMLNPLKMCMSSDQLSGRNLRLQN